MTTMTNDETLLIQQQLKLSLYSTLTLCNTQLIIDLSDTNTALRSKLLDGIVSCVNIWRDSNIDRIMNELTTSEDLVHRTDMLLFEKDTINSMADAVLKLIIDEPENTNNVV